MTDIIMEYIYLFKNVYKSMENEIVYSLKQENARLMAELEEEKRNKHQNEPNKKSLRAEFSSAISDLLVKYSNLLPDHNFDIKITHKNKKSVFFCVNITVD